MKRKKNKEWKEKYTVKHKEVGNIEKNMFVIFGYISKISERERKLMATNY